MTLKKDDHVITNKGNHGRIVSINGNVAEVKIGRNVFEIESQNLTNINNGSMFEVEYIEGVKKGKSSLFVKHGTVLFDTFGGELLYSTLQNQLISLLNKQVLITKISIP